MADLALSNLKEKLERLGVNVRLDPLSSFTAALPQQREDEPATRATGAANARAPDPARRRAAMAANPQPKSRRDVADLLHKIDNIEVAMNTAEAVSHVARDKLELELMRSPVLMRSDTSPDREDRDTAAVRVKKPVARKPKLPKPGLVSTAMAAAAARPHGGSNAYAMSSSQQHLQGLPMHTPLSSVLAQYKQAEATWAQEKARLRREADEERRRANKCDLELKKNQRLLEHKRLDVKALKAALKNRDNQLAASGERIKELEEAMARTQEESAARLSALNAERDDLKALLLATLQRLEAVDEMVSRADMSSTVMQEKLSALEQERMRALEAAARARAEVQELSESRRKLQWQSKLLEKMSEVQLKHNKHKSEAIRKLLSQPPVPGGAAGDGEDDALGEDSSMLVADSYRLHQRGAY